MANEGLITFFIPMDDSAAFMKKVFPAPRFPFNTTLSPFLQKSIKSAAIDADSLSLLDLIFEG